jgi:simple sugar transport system substrate-binding protein
VFTSKKRRLAIASAATFALGALALTGCSAQGTSPTATGPGKGMSVMVIGGPLSDPFFSAVDQGGKEAAANLGATYEYAAPKDFSNAPADLANLIKTAVNKKVNVLVVGDFIPPAEEPDIQKAVAAGITVVIYNSGLNSYAATGAVGFVGEDPAATGAAAGKAEAAKGVKNAVCVNHVPENPVLQVRCDAFGGSIKAGGGSFETLTVTSVEAGDPQVLQQKISGYLKSHPAVDGIFTLGSSQAVAAEKAIADTGSKAVLGTTDINLQVLNDVKSGKLLFAIDQQGYLQTFYGVTMGIQERAYGMHPITPVITSPLVITQSNVDKVLEVQKTYGNRGGK